MSVEDYPTNESEPDAEYAQSIAIALNKLIDEKIITTEAVSRAPDEAFFEFAITYDHEIKRTASYSAGETSFGSEQKEKIKRTFLEKGEANKNTDIDEAIALSRGFLQELQRKDSNLVGLVAYGSRLNPRKAPLPESDLDVILISKDPWATHEKLGKLKYMDLRIVFEGVEFIASEIMSEKYFIDSCGEGEEPVKDRLSQWEYFPDAVKYIGNLGILSESRANNFIQMKLTAEKATAIKTEILAGIKEFMKSE